jgi:hypothetical protein
MALIAESLVLDRDVYSKEKFRNVKEFSSALPEAPILDQFATHLAFSSSTFGSKNFPMLLNTLGSGNVKTIPAGHYEYKYPILGKPKKSSVISRTLHVTGDRPGAGRQSFTIAFEDNHMNNQSTIVKNWKGKRLSLRVQGEPRKNSAFNDYEYTVSLWEADAASWCPVEVLAQGTEWAESIAKVPQEDSYGVTSKSYLPGRATNMLSLVRHGMKFKGNVNNVVMVYKIKADGKTFTTFAEWDMFLADLEYKEKCEYDLWFSKYGKDANGEVYMIDENTSLPVTSGAGIDEQIPNSDTYSYLTYNKLFNLIRDVTFNVTDTIANIQIYTGTGGMDAVDLMLKNELKGFSMVAQGALNDKLVEGTGFNMVFGAFFKSLRHIDGHMITFIKHPMFDRGIEGTASEITASGLPASSYDMYFIDNSLYDTKEGRVNNIMYVQEEGREYTTYKVAGATNAKHIGITSELRSSDRDRSEVHGVKSQGIQIMKPQTCFKLKYVGA